MMLARLVFLCLVCAFAQSEVMLQVSFDINQDMDSETSLANLNAYLTSTNLKWLRYYHVLISGAPSSVPMRVAHLVFNNISTWAQFEQDNLLHTHVLMDNYWVKGRRNLWKKTDSPIAKSRTERSNDNRGGYVYILQYSIQQGREDVFNARFTKAKEQISRILVNEPNYIEAKSFKSGQVQSQYNIMETYEFNDLPSLTKVMYGDSFTGAVDDVKQFMTDFSVIILTPGTGDSAALFWRAAGADREDGPGGEDL